MELRLEFRRQKLACPVGEKQFRPDEVQSAAPDRPPLLRRPDDRHEEKRVTAPFERVERIGVGGRALQNQLVGHLQRGKPLKQPAAPVTPRTVDVQQSAAPERGEHAVEPLDPVRPVSATC